MFSGATWQKKGRHKHRTVIFRQIHKSGAVYSCFSTFERVLDWVRTQWRVTQITGDLTLKVSKAAVILKRFSSIIFSYDKFCLWGRWKGNENYYRHREDISVDHIFFLIRANVYPLQKHKRWSKTGSFGKKRILLYHAESDRRKNRWKYERVKSKTKRPIPNETRKKYTKRENNSKSRPKAGK